MIAGFDPGTTAALAILDLRGNLLFSRSFKGGFAEAVRMLSNFRPSVVASDKKDVRAVHRLAASFGAVAFFPANDLGVREKAALVSRFRLRDQHQKDALAAALYAHRHYRRLIERVLSKEQEIFEKLIKDELANISRALESRREVSGRPRKRDFSLESRVKDLEGKLELAGHLLAKKQEELDAEKGKGRRRVVRRVRSPVDAEEERRARRRLERELMESHGRLGKIEAELKKLRKATPKEKEDISRRVIRMIQEYKERFRK